MGADADADDWSVVAGVDTGSDFTISGMPLLHAVEVNAATRDTAHGPELVAVWTWAAGLLTEDRAEELARAVASGPSRPWPHTPNVPTPAG